MVKIDKDSLSIGDESSKFPAVRPPVEIIQVANFAVVRLRGTVDESFDPNSVKVHSKNVVFDMQDVEVMTSFGIREWKSMVVRLHEEKRHFYFFNCPVEIFNQFNMIAGFGGAGQIVSFYAPFYCERCAIEQQVLIDLVHDHAKIAALEEPEARCMTCGLPIDFDDNPHDFFSFVASQPKPDFPPSGIDFCRRIGVTKGRGLGTQLRIRKAVSGQVTLVKLYGIIDEELVRRSFRGLEGNVLFDMSEIEAVSPTGAQKFATALEAVRTSSSNLWITGASPPLCRALVSEASLQALRGHVSSFRAPYRCNTDNQTVAREIWLHEHWDALKAGKAPELACEKCKAALLPQFEASYFSFLPEQPPATLSTESQAAAQNSERFLFEASLECSIDPSLETDAEVAKPGQIAAGSMLGKYRLESLIGSGGMAEVYLASQVGPEGFEKRVVVKRVLPHLLSSQEFIDQFLDEARLSAYFTHPNIVQIYELCKETSEFFIAMEYVDGPTLSSLVTRCRKLRKYMPIPVALRFTYDLLQALDYAHEQTDRDGKPLAVIHRDVSLNNVLVNKRGIVKLVDFGIASASSRIHLTRPGTIKGKIRYMAPEQFQEAKLDRRVDIYSSGVVLYELLTMTHLFKGTSEGALIYAVINQKPPPMSKARQSSDEELDAIVARALAKDKAKRYPTAGSFANVLQEYCAKRYGRFPDPVLLRTWMEDLDRAFMQETQAPDSLPYEREEIAPNENDTEHVPTKRLKTNPGANDNDEPAAEPPDSPLDEPKT
ncbi:MAG: protein kinase [Deltaproteobacteria bacterium]|nr:protein kinase [Deltaproteobacteria bacterium]